MIVPTTTTLGIQCSKCGELQFRAISLFTFSRFQKESFYCVCGAHIATLTQLEKGIFNIEYPCIYCGDTHSLITNRCFIRKKEILPLKCSAKNNLIGHLGPKDQVVNCCQDMKKNFVQFVCQLVNDEDKEPEFDIFFNVYGVMEKLGKMVERGLLGCRCGNKSLAVEILPDRIELNCDQCGALGIIYTDRKDILRTLDDLRSISLQENSVWVINDAFEDLHLQKNN